MASVAEVFSFLAVLSVTLGFDALRCQRRQRLSHTLDDLRGDRARPGAGRPRDQVKKPLQEQAPLPAAFRWVDRRARQAGVRIGLNTVLVLILGSAAALFVLAESVLGQSWIAVLAALGGLYAPVFYLDRQAARRARLALEQLDGVCRGIAQAMRAGMSLQQALNAAAEGLDAPLGPELGRVVRGIRFGGSPVRDAVLALEQGIRLPEMRLLVAGMRLHLDTGSDLPAILDGLTDTIRSRRDARNAMLAATAQGRLQANILIALPFFLMFVFRLIYPSYLDPLFDTLGGRIVFILAMGWLLLGYTIMRRLLSGGVSV